MAALTVLRSLILLLVLAVAAPIRVDAAAPGATDQQVKAVFVYNFSRFVEWPASAFAADAEPFVIGVVGNDSFAALLEDVVRGESAGTHPILVRRYPATEDELPAHLLFIDRSAGASLAQMVALADVRGTLIVSDAEEAASRGAMIELATVKSRIRMRVNMDHTRAAGLSVNSNLLRQAEIVRNGAPR